MATAKFLVTKLVNNQPQGKLYATFLPGVGVAMRMDDGEERTEIEKAIRWLHADSAAISADMTIGYRVSKL